MHDYTTPAGLTIRAIPTDNGGGIEDTFQRKLEELGITQFTPPDIPQYNGVVERAPWVLREKSNALLKGFKQQDVDPHVERFLEA